MAASGEPAPSAPSFLARLGNGLRRVPTLAPAWAWACLFAAALCLPSLARFGFWDPWELKLAEQARDVARVGHLFDPTADGRYPGGRALNMLLSAAGISIFGPSELGARLPIALSAMAALLAVYWAGTSLLRPRAALLATVVLGTMPLFVLEARQLTSDAPLIAALALALGGLGRYAWPPDGKRRARDLVIGLVAMALGEYAGGAMLGVLLPALAVSAAVLVGYGLVGSAEATDGTAPARRARRRPRHPGRPRDRPQPALHPARNRGPRRRRGGGGRAARRSRSSARSPASSRSGWAGSRAAALRSTPSTR